MTAKNKRSLKMVEKLEQIREIGFWLLRGGAVGVAVSIRVFGRGGSYVNDFDLPSHQSIKNLHAEQLAHKSWDFESGKFRSKLSFMFFSSVRRYVGSFTFFFIAGSITRHQNQQNRFFFQVIEWQNWKFRNCLVKLYTKQKSKTGGVCCVKA